MSKRFYQLLLFPRLRNLAMSTVGTLRALVVRLVIAPVSWQTRQQLSRLSVVGGLGSIPSRAGSLPRVLDTILPQVERLHLFLHGYESVPPEVIRPGVIVHLAPASDPYRTAGKFFGLAQEPQPCIYCTFDDDILYGDGHVARLRAALIRYSGRALVGIHSASFRPSTGSYLHRQVTRHFTRGLWVDQLADEIGTGTGAFVSSVLPVDPTTWPHGFMDDLMMAIEASRALQWPAPGAALRPSDAISLTASMPRSGRTTRPRPSKCSGCYTSPAETCYFTTKAGIGG
jgi:hypothetical protein